METKMKIFLFFSLSLSQVYRPRPFNGAAITSGKFENLAKFLDYTEGERDLSATIFCYVNSHYIIRSKRRYAISLETI